MEDILITTREIKSQWQIKKSSVDNSMINLHGGGGVWYRVVVSNILLWQNKGTRQPGYKGQRKSVHCH